MKYFEYQYISHSDEATRHLGMQLGSKLVRGTVILLSGELGSGKTAFAQGLAKGLDAPPECYVTSPTYTLINEYPGRLPFVHVDLFRLEGALDLENIGLADLLDQDHVVAIEWPERLHPSDIPENHLKIQFAVENRSTRKIHLIACGLQMIDLIKDISIVNG